MKELLCLRTALHCNALMPLSTTTLLVGQYELNSSSSGTSSKASISLRSGRIDVVSFSAADGETAASRVDSVALECGVFEMLPLDPAASGGLICAVGCTDGSVKFLARAESGVGVGVVQSIEMGKEMVTSLVCHFDANTTITTGGGGSSGDSALVVATHHQGMVSVHHGARRLHCSFPAHEFDAWCVAQALEPPPASDDGFGLSVPPSAYRRSRNIIFTGGDDAKLKVWDLDPLLLQTASQQQQQQQDEDANSASDNDDSSSSAAAVVPQMKPLGSASFGAGVVTIVPLSPFVCLVGTYDEKVHLVDLRTLLTPAARRKSVDAEDAAISTVTVDGGAWRIRELSPAAAAASTAEPSSCDRFFVVAAMQAGAKLVGLESKTGRLHNLSWAHRATPLHNFSTIIAKHPQQQQQQQQAEDSGSAAAAETQPAEVVVPQEPLIYDVAELCIGGKPAVATVSFYANELKLWA